MKARTPEAKRLKGANVWVAAGAGLNSGRSQKRSESEMLACHANGPKEHSSIERTVTCGRREANICSFIGYPFHSRFLANYRRTGWLTLS